MTTKAGISLSDAKDVTLEDVRITTETCPAMTCNNVRGLRMINAEAIGPVEKVEGHLGDL
jgi:hypothetical protein